MNFKTKDNKEIYVHKFENVQGDVKGVIQIAHGMSEHIGRYEHFASELNKNGYLVYGNDHRGHGKSVKSMEELGILADSDGFNKMVEDMYTLSKKIKEKHPNLPLFLFGHSMGSFLSQRYIMLHGDILKGVVLSGSNGRNAKLLMKFGQMKAQKEVEKVGRENISKDLNRLIFKKSKKSIGETKTKFDWLSRYKEEVQKYIDDPYCGFIFSAGAFQDLIDGVELIARSEEIAKVPKDLPILLVSGTKDHIGNFGKGVIKLRDTYKDFEIKDVEMKLYEGARHEVVKELNKEESIGDIIDFLNRHL